VKLRIKIKGVKMTGKRGGRWLWSVNGGVRAATSKGHPIPEMHWKKDYLHSASKQMLKKVLFLIVATTVHR